MHEQPFAVDRDQRPRRQPGDQLIAVRRLDDGIERVLSMRATMAGRNGEEVKVVITEHRGCGIAQSADFAQHRQRVRAAIHEIADQPQAIRCRREADQVEQLAELGMATLDVADCVVRH